MKQAIYRRSYLRQRGADLRERKGAVYTELATGREGSETL